MRNLRFLAVAFALLCCLPAFGDKIADIHPQNYVTDLAGVIAGTTAERLNALCAEVQQKTGAQIAVVTVRSLDGRPIEDYAVDLFKHLGVGGKKDDRGVLLLIAPSDRRYRFEVGYGLEPVITDARAGDIGREMVPLLRQNDYSAAAELGVNRAAALIAADSHVTLDRVPAASSGGGGEPSTAPWWLMPLGFFILLLVLRALFGGRGRRSRRSSFWWMGPWGGWGGGGWGGGGWSGGGFGGSSGGFGGFGGFGGGGSGGGGASGSW